jgi:hypothetical protein
LVCQTKIVKSSTDSPVALNIQEKVTNNLPVLSLAGEQGRQAGGSLTSVKKVYPLLFILDCCMASET